jgi:hypothetical protein
MNQRTKRVWTNRCGRTMAVLDPDAKQAKRIFNLREVVKTMQA